MAAALLSACTSSPEFSPLDEDPYPDGAIASLPATHPQLEQRCPVTPAWHYDPQRLPVEQVTAAYICTARPWTPDPQGRARTMQHIDGIPLEALPALLEAFTASDVSATRPCDDIEPEPLVVWLHHDGGVDPVRAPVDACRRPLASAAAAWADLPRTRLQTASETEGFPN
jgi:hypothetical protein